MAKKKMSLYYDDVKDKDLITFIDGQKGSISRNAYILTILYGIKNNANYTPIRSIKEDIQSVDITIQENKNNINTENKKSFLKSIKK